MEQYTVKIKSINKVTHDVLQIVTEKPQQYNFTPGQATEVSINKNGWQNEKRPFTFTCLPDNDYLEFTIKTYPLHKGVTNQLLQLKKDDELILHDVFGDIAYKTKADIILEQELKKLLGNNFINILSDEKAHGYANGQITEDFIKATSGGIKKIFYVCGPPPMMEAIGKQLANLHVNEKSIIKETF